MLQVRALLFYHSLLLTSYSGDMLNPEKKYNHEYYMELAEKIVKIGTHILGIKDMVKFLSSKS